MVLPVFIWPMLTNSMPSFSDLALPGMDGLEVLSQKPARGTVRKGNAGADAEPRRDQLDDKLAGFGIRGRRLPGQAFELKEVDARLEVLAPPWPTDQACASSRWLIWSTTWKP